MKSNCYFRVPFVSLLVILTNTQAFFYPQLQRYIYTLNHGCNCDKSHHETDDVYHGHSEQLTRIFEQLQQLATESPNHGYLPVANKEDVVTNKEDIAAKKENIVANEEDIVANVKKFKVKEVEPQKALACANLQCAPDAYEGAVCACNHLTGKVASFKNSCDMAKHNCRFDTVFKVILNEICPWEFQSRRSTSNIVDSMDYEDPKYYN